MALVTIDPGRQFRREAPARSAAIAAKAPVATQGINPAPRPVCVLIVGMHRSGTSALARVVSLFGAKLPAHVMAPGADNESGFWEPQRLVALHDQMLAQMGSSWDDWRSLDLTGPEFAPGGRYWIEISRIVEDEYGDAPLIVLKDPRICRFASFYADLMASIGYEVKFAHAFRNPLDVAASLQRRNGVAPSLSHLIWLRHVLDAEAATRGACRAFSSYGELIRAPVQGAERIAERLGIDRASDESVRAAIDGFVDKAHRHHASDEAALRANPEVADWLKGAYRSLAALQRNPNDPRALAELDRIRDAFNTAIAYVGAPILAEREKQLASLKAAVDRGNARIEELEKSLAGKDLLSKKLNDQLIKLNEQLNAARMNPFRAPYDLLAFGVLTALLLFRFWMTPRLAEKCARSAEKRNPRRSVIL
jgi:hypothetical protein